MRSLDILYVVAALLALDALAPPGSAFGRSFVRGDVNDDASVDITDPVALLSHLFRGAAAPSCDDAADANDDGELGIADAIRTLGALFQGAPPLPAPFPRPGGDPTPDPLRCGDERPDELFVDDTEFPSPGALPPPAFTYDASAWLLPRSEARGRAGDDGALVVSDVVLDWLTELPAGASLAEGLLDTDLTPSDRTIVERLLDRRPASGSPRAVLSRLTVPIDSSTACWPVDTAVLAGASFDTSPAPSAFVRGDVDGNGVVDIADLERMRLCFALHRPPYRACWEDCPAAWDMDDDGQFALGDASLLADVLSGVHGRRPEAPWPNCGVDPTPEAVAECGRGTCVGSRDGLQITVSPTVLCGPGTHEVQVVVRDAEGNESRASALVTLCESSRADCPPTLVAAGTPPEPEHDYAVRCTWIVVANATPRERRVSVQEKTFTRSGGLDRVIDAPPYDAASPSEWCSRGVGPGPAHHVFGARRNPNCQTPDTDLDKYESGLYLVRVGMLCLDERGCKVDPECAADVAVEAIYLGEVEAATAAGGTCAGVPGRVEALAIDETSFTVDDRAVFAKGVSVQNGTEVSTSPDFELAIGMEAGTDLASSVGVKHGVSTTTRDGTGRDRDELRAQALARPGLPTSFSLHAKGLVRLTGAQRTAASGVASTRLAALWFALSSDCPGADNWLGWMIGGRPDEIEDARVMLDGFAISELGGSVRR